ncbi:MAG: hypothetical protein ABJO57_10060 [Lentilitoribacter sp.]
MYNWASPHMKWFVRTFGDRIDKRIRNTPYTKSFVTAVATQETAYVFGPLRRRIKDEQKLLSLLVLDTYGWSRRRSYFPRSRQELLNAPNGKKMFQIARNSLEAIAKEREGFVDYANERPKQILFGYGIFQYDLQEFRNDPSFFLDKKWYNFEACLEKAIGEFDEKAKQMKYKKPRNKYSRDQLVRIGIVYNLGFKRYKPKGDYSQGFKNPTSGIRYGTYIDNYMKLADKITGNT